MTAGAFNLVRSCRKNALWLAVVTLLALAQMSLAEIRFPPPEFESGYSMPATQNPLPRPLWREYLDVGVLVVTLGLAAWFVHRQRSRKAVFGLALFSMLYFGFYRQGCVCAIGSIQNVSLGLFQSGYALPLAAFGFFALPLSFALFFGRTFCAAVCPHGALQDLVLVKPVSIPRWLEHGLGTIPFLYLGLAVLFAGTGSAFIICRYDPFIPLFRLSGSFNMLALGAGFLVVGLFIGRPYCRFLCPYGALLRMASVVARWRVRVTPDVCTQCKLCQPSCPYGVIREPVEAHVTPKNIHTERHRLVALVVVLPVLIGLGALSGGRFGEWSAGLNPEVKLAAQHLAQQSGQTSVPIDKADEIALARAERTAAVLIPAAQAALKQFRIGGVLFGGWVGLVIGVRLLGIVLARKRIDYEPDRGGCCACARCFSSCPQERLRLGLPAEAPAVTSSDTIIIAKPG